jgi:hypothetical protein
MKGHTMENIELGDFITLEIDRNAHTPTTLMGEVTAIAEGILNPDHLRVQVRHLFEYITIDEKVAVVSVIKAAAHV